MSTRQAALLHYALSYAARGWHAFVLSASKSPLKNCAVCAAEHHTPEQMQACQCLTCHGFYAATTDRDRITEMVRRHPRGLFAIRTGAVSGLAVVDVDIKKWDADGFLPADDDTGYATMSGLDERRLLPGTLMQTTGGGGLHFLYGHPGGQLLSGAGKYGPGVDSKADGGYIVVAPSVSRSGRYEWTGDGRYDRRLTPLPQGLAEMVRPPAPVTVTSRRTSSFSTGLPGVRSRLHGLVDAVLNASAGERNDLLHWAAKKAGEMVAAGEVDQSTVIAVLQDVGVTAGLTASEVGDGSRGTIASGLRKGRSAA